MSAATAPSGNLRFSVTNTGSKVNEFYLLAEDGLRIVGEVENIGPGLTRDLVLQAAPGKYFTACKPGMVGDGIRAEFTVSDSGETLAPNEDEKELVAQANTLYAAYVRDQTDQLLAKTQEFTTAFTAGDFDRARELYAPARVHWERIETVAESFGDLDPEMDAREADLEPGQKWTGWHRIEKDLWPQRAEGYTRDDRGRAVGVRRQPAGQHRDALQADPGHDLHRRPDRQRRQGSAGRGRDRQGDRRGGVLVADRPVGLPGQRRRRPGRRSTG